MFDKLNADCWLHILKYVTLYDQLSLAQTCERLRGNVEYFWQHLKDADINYDVLNYFEERPEEMQKFLQLASGSVQSMKIKRPNTRLLKLWQSHSFPKLVSLDCNMGFGTEEESDEGTLLLTQLFPHLTYLTLLSGTTGRHIWNWSQLQELHLICCESLDTSLFNQIFSSLPLRKLTLLFYGYSVNLGDGILPIARCETLEELVIDDHHLLGNVMPTLLRLPKLHRLAFYTRDYYEWLLQIVAKSKPLRVKSLLFNDSFWSSSNVSDIVLRLPNLRRLTLYDDDIESHDLYSICAKLSHLEELHLIKMRAMPTPTQLWEMVGACNSLRVLNLSDSKLDKQFLDLSATSMEKVLSQRNPSAHLTLHLHNTILERSSEKVIAALRHPNLTISFEAVEMNNWSSRFIEIEFDSI